MIVCVCHRVTESQIAAHVLAGCASFEALQGDLRVATGCGACRDCARSAFDEARGGGASLCGAMRRPVGGGQALAAA